MDGMACPVCSLDGTLRAQSLTEARDRQGRMVIIRDVPAFVCDRCGSRVYDEHTTRTLEHIYAHAANDRAEMYVVRLGDFTTASRAGRAELAGRSAEGKALKCCSDA